MGLIGNVAAAAAALALLAACGGDHGEVPGHARGSVTRPASMPMAAAAPDIARQAPPPRAAVVAGEFLTYGPAGEVRREPGYTWYPAGVSKVLAVAAQAGRPLRLVLPDGAAVELRYVRHVRHDDGVWTWIGRSEAGLDDAILTFGRHAVFGTIPRRGGPPVRVTTQDLHTWIVVADPDARLPDAWTHRPDFLVPAAATAVASEPVTSATTAAAPAYTSTEKQTVDLVLGYTTGFKEHWVSPTMCSRLGAVSCTQVRRDNTLARLNFLVDVANQAYVNSAVAAQLQLVRTVEVPYSDTTSNETALKALTGSDGSLPSTPDAAFNPLRTARDQFGADLVSLVRTFQMPEHGGCGIAWLIGGGLAGVKAADAPFGYSVVSDGTDSGSDGLSYYCLDETLAHELGHNMGAQHDQKTAGSGTGAFSYAYGYKASWFYTIMAYGESGQTSYRVFSNPRVTYCGGQSCGTAAADNARTLTQTIPVVASFRTAVVAPPRANLMRFDANANGQSDLFFSSMSGLAVWYMSGATRTAYSAYTAYVDGDRLVDVGDLAGDGRNDLLYVDSTNHMFYLGSTGSGFEGSTLAESMPPDWSPIAMIDINGDGRRAEIVLRNPFTGAGAVWFYKGSSRTSYNGFNVPAGYTFVGSGDLNGDRRSDLVWTDVGGTILVSFSTGSGLAAPTQVPLTYDTRYSLVGVSDANADGRSDLVFWRGATRQLVAWLMQGTARVSYFSSIVPAGYWLVGQGDFDGDRKDDLAWTNGSRQLLLSFSTGAGFNHVYLPYIVAPGWTTMGIH